MVSFSTFKCPLFPKPVSWLRLFCRFLQQTSSNTKFEMSQEQGFFYWLTVVVGVKFFQELWSLAKFGMGQVLVFCLWIPAVILTVIPGSILLQHAFAFSITNLDVDGNRMAEPFRLIMVIRVVEFSSGGVQNLKKKYLRINIPIGSN